MVSLTSSSASPPAINLFSIGRVRSHAPSRVQTDSPFLPSRFFLLHLLVKFHDPLMPSGEQKGEGEGVSLTYSTRPRSRRRGHKMVPETAAGMVVEAVGQMKVRGHPHCQVRDQFIHFNMIKKVKFHQPSSNLTCSFSDTNMAVAVCGRCSGVAQQR